MKEARAARPFEARHALAYRDRDSLVSLTRECRFSCPYGINNTAVPFTLRPKRPVRGVSASCHAGRWAAGSALSRGHVARSGRIPSLVFGYPAGHSLDVARYRASRCDGGGHGCPCRFGGGMASDHPSRRGEATQGPATLGRGAWPLGQAGDSFVVRPVARGMTPLHRRNTPILGETQFCARSPQWALVCAKTSSPAPQMLQAGTAHFFSAASRAVADSARIPANKHSAAPCVRGELTRGDPNSKSRVSSTHAALVAGTALGEDCPIPRHHLVSKSVRTCAG